MKRILVSALFMLLALRIDAQSLAEQRTAAATAATYMRTLLPPGRVAVVVDSEFNPEINTFLADSLALPTATRADIANCRAIRKCRITQGGSAIFVESVAILGDTAIVKMHTIFDLPSFEMTEARAEEVRLQRRLPSGSWFLVSKKLVWQT